MKCGEEYFDDFDRENGSRRKLKKTWTLWNDIKNTIRDKAEAEIVSKNDTIEEVANLKMDGEDVKGDRKEKTHNPVEDGDVEVAKLKMDGEDVQGDTKEKTHNPVEDGDGRKKRSWYSIKFTGRKRTTAQLITATKRRDGKKRGGQTKRDGKKRKMISSKTI